MNIKKALIPVTLSDGSKEIVLLLSSKYSRIEEEVACLFSRRWVETEAGEKIQVSHLMKVGTPTIYDHLLKVEEGA